MNYLGIDIGTSGCKAVVFDRRGNKLISASREYNVLFSPDGGAELDSDKVIQNCFAVIKECASGVAARSVRGLGISSQGEAFTAIGPDGESLCNALISSDVRALPHAKSWPLTFGEEKLYWITGHTAHPMFTLFKLLWLKDRRPGIWRRARKFLCFEDLLQFRLGLEPAIGWPLAGRTMMFDVSRHDWHGEILDAVGLSPDQLAIPRPSGSVVGEINQGIARDLGLSPGTFVVAGGHDQTCGALGAGVTQPGVAMYATGSVECITAAFDQPIFSRELQDNNLCTYDYTVHDMYATIAYSLTGGNILKWFRDQFGMHEMAEAARTGGNAYEMLLKGMAHKPSGLLVLPYFTPSGTPYFDASTKGAIFGLQLSTSRGEFIRALLEGVAFEMRLNIEILNQSGYTINQLRLIGGGAKSAAWTQLKADVTGKKMTTLNVQQAGCLGMAMLACAADTGIAVWELAQDWVQPLDEVYPIDENRHYYDRRYSVYRDLYSHVRQIVL